MKTVICDKCGCTVTNDMCPGCGAICEPVNAEKKPFDDMQGEDLNDPVVAYRKWRTETKAGRLVAPFNKISAVLLISFCISIALSLIAEVIILFFTASSDNILILSVVSSAISLILACIAFPFVIYNEFTLIFSAKPFCEKHGLDLTASESLSFLVNACHFAKSKKCFKLHCAFLVPTLIWFFVAFCQAALWPLYAYLISLSYGEGIQLGLMLFLLECVFRLVLSVAIPAILGGVLAVIEKAVIKKTLNPKI